jgi:hypothetical protein
MRRHAEVEVATLAGPVPLRVAADDTVAAVTQARSALRFLTLLNTLRRAAYFKRPSHGWDAAALRRPRPADLAGR